MTYGSPGDFDPPRKTVAFGYVMLFLISLLSVAVIGSTIPAWAITSAPAQIDGTLPEIA